MRKLMHKLKRTFLHEDHFKDELEYRLRRGLTIGENTHIYSVEGIDGNWPWLIQIGNNVTISSNVTILAHDASTNVVHCATKLGRVVIGDNVFIGTGSIVLCNTKIGNNVIVGAGSVVTHDLPDNAVYAGSPARYICSIAEYQKKYKELYQTRPHFDGVHTWNEWASATSEERGEMRDKLENGIGFV